MKRLRDVYEQLDGMTLPLDKSLAFQLLTKVDVRSAMSFAIASGGDPNYRNIMLHMRQDTIWQFWMERDLKIVNDVLGGELPGWVTMLNSEEARKNGYNPVEAPVWKNVYLWMRLVISARQYRIIEQFTAEKFPVTSRFVFVTLNELRIGSDIFDFRIEFPRFYKAVMENDELWQRLEKRPYDTSYTAQNMAVYRKELTSSRSEPSYVMSFLMRFFFENVYISTSAASDYERIIVDISNSLFTYVGPEASYIGQYKDYLWQKPAFIHLLSSPPRLIEATRIIVASCVSCNTPDAGFQCAHCDKAFCSLQCQINTH